MNTGVLDKNGKEIKVGDIVHYRGDGLCAHGIVVQDDYYGFVILDDRPKTKGRRYSLEYVKGRENKYINPVIKELPRLVDIANKTMNSMLSIIRQFGHISGQDALSDFLGGF